MMQQNVPSTFNAHQFLNLYRQVYHYGVHRAPRGQKCIDRMNVQVAIDTTLSPLTSFSARKLNLNYAKKELLCYLEADPYADWIQQHAIMWKKLKQPSGQFYSNYGQYLFTELTYHPGSQFDFVVNELIRDCDSRRAVMVLLQPHHLFKDNIDVVCTYAMHFAIYNGALYMNVMMRSNDVIYGFTNDCFCFWCIYQMIYAKLHEVDVKLLRGMYTHFTNSMHVYESHYPMIQQILHEGVAGYEHITVPYVTANGVRHLLKSGRPAEADDFCQWLQADS